MSASTNTGILIPLCLAAAATSAQANNCEAALDKSTQTWRPYCEGQSWLLKAEVWTTVPTSKIETSGPVFIHDGCTQGYTDCGGASRNNFYRGKKEMWYQIRLNDPQFMDIYWTITDEYVRLDPCIEFGRQYESRQTITSNQGWMTVFCN